MSTDHNLLWVLTLTAALSVAACTSRSDIAESTRESCEHDSQPVIQCAFLYDPESCWEATCPPGSVAPTGDDAGRQEQHLAFDADLDRGEPVNSVYASIGPFVVQGSLWAYPAPEPEAGFSLSFLARRGDGLALLQAKRYTFGELVCDDFLGGGSFTGVTSYVALPGAIGLLQYQCNVK
jgi:hypothetical protein